MIYKARYIGIGALMALMLTLVFSTVVTVKANPSFFLVQNNGLTTTATTSLTYMTAGTATSTTRVIDAGAGGAQGADSGVLALQFTGSSTPTNAATATTTYNVTIEYARGGQGDCVANPTICSWYSDNTFASSTVSQVISSPVVRQIQLGTQTLAGVLLSSSTPTAVLVNVPMPTRYARAVISIQPGSTNGAVWAEFIDKRQNP